MQKITTGTIHLFTYKDGLLARLAHDLRLQVRRFEIELDGDAVTVRLRTDSFWPEGPMANGRLDASGLSDSDRAKIAENITDRILHASRHPEVVFRGRGVKDAGSFTLEGTLELAGQSGALKIPVRREGSHVRGEVTIQPTRWGVEPYKAMAGAIKLQDKVRAEFDIELP